MARKVWNMKGCSKKRRVMRGGCDQCLGGGSNRGQMGGQGTRRGTRRRTRRRGGCGSICAAAAPLLLLGGKKPCGCNKIPFFNGGKQRGGNASASAFVGAPITATSSGNHYALNPEVNNPNNPSVIMANRDNSFVPSHSTFSMKGGRRRRSRRVKRGGGFNLIPQDITNMFRGIQFNAGSSYNAMQGYKPPVNPLPYKDQMANSFGNTNY